MKTGDIADSFHLIWVVFVLILIHSIHPSIPAQNLYLANFDSRALHDVIVIHLAAAIETLQSFTAFSGCPFLLIIEDRPQGIGSTIFREIRRICNANIFVIKGSGPKADPVPGVPIDNNIKREMTLYIASLLRNRRIRYSTNATTASQKMLLDITERYIAKTSTCQEKSIRTTMTDYKWLPFESLDDELHAQMSRWEEFTEESGPDGARTVKFFYSGKGPSGTLNDDMAICFGMIHHVERYRSFFKRSLPTGTGYS